VVWAAFSPLILLYVTAMVFIINNEIFQGTQAITLRPIED
jgi:hypothetical protein